MAERLLRISTSARVRAARAAEAEQMKRLEEEQEGTTEADGSAALPAAEQGEELEEAASAVPEGTAASKHGDAVQSQSASSGMPFEEAKSDV